MERFPSGFADGLDITPDGYICQGCGHRWVGFYREDYKQRTVTLLFDHEGPHSMTEQEVWDHAKECVKQKPTLR